MLSRTAASRRAAVVTASAAAVRATTPRIAALGQRALLPTATTMSATRSISVWPSRSKKPIDPTLPVYFPQPPPPSHQHQHQHQQRLPSWRKVRYALFTLLVYYALWQIYMSVVLDPLLDWAEEEWDSLSEKEKEELEEAGEDEMDEEEEPLLFLPFPFTTKQIAQPPYRGSDPEWKEFVKVNKDEKRKKDIKRSLAETVRRRAEANPVIVNLMGGKTTKVRKMWLDIIYPPAPPPKHYISGLIVDYDGLFWGDRSIETVAANQIDAIMYPKAVAMAVWTFWDVLLKRSKDDISRALGLSGTQEPETSWQSVIINRGKEQQQQQQSPAAGTVLNPPSAAPSSNDNPQAKASQPGSIQGPPDFANLFRRLGGGGAGGEGGERGDGAAPASPMSQSVMFAFQAASLVLAKNWKRTEHHVSKGCIRVDGMVELQGRSAFMVVYVLGWYDPKTDKFMKVETKLKHLVQTKQKPLGGK
ncbi:hypothetical protein GMORB2_3857 [Geosmithia morbida]|uniref:Uncharacterized protein n=1 Tax=Geosmithia morbida TaxID=1094350 RepID=A0A9P4YXQ9_9HYPO|nr:uncharacterized protein GMORB2_3857 [Geosmithia morbida]KAF4125018.1 hypothetical protein GMORB2_3857 [Geosmithia morbida]